MVEDPEQLADLVGEIIDPLVEPLFESLTEDLAEFPDAARFELLLEELEAHQPREHPPEIVWNLLFQDGRFLHLDEARVLIDEEGSRGLGRLPEVPRRPAAGL